MLTKTILPVLASASFALIAPAIADEAKSAPLVMEVKAATVIDGKSGIHIWNATTQMPAEEGWVSLGPSVMLPKAMFIVSSHMEYNKEGGTPFAVLSPRLEIKEADFKEIEAGEGVKIHTFMNGESPAAVRVYDDKFYLYLSTDKPGKLDVAQAHKELVKLLTAMEIKKAG